MAEEKLYELYSAYDPVAVEWLWYPYIPYSKITIIQGDPGEGKTSLVLRLAAALSKGESLITQQECSQPINVIYQSAEDGITDTVVPRLIEAGADRSRIAFINEEGTPISMLDPRIEEAINKHDAKLSVLDPLQAFLGAVAAANGSSFVFEKLCGLIFSQSCRQRA